MPLKIRSLPYEFHIFCWDKLSYNFFYDDTTLTKFCTYHDSIAVMPCAKIGQDLIIIISLINKNVTHEIWIRAHKYCWEKASWSLDADIGEQIWLLLPKHIQLNAWRLVVWEIDLKLLINRNFVAIYFNFLASFNEVELMVIELNFEALVSLSGLICVYTHIGIRLCVKCEYLLHGWASWCDSHRKHWSLGIMSLGFSDRNVILNPSN